MRVPFVRLSGRWLEAFGFKEGAKFTAVGVCQRRDHLHAEVPWRSGRAQCPYERRRHRFHGEPVVPDTWLLDIPTDFNGYVAENYDDVHRSRVTTRDALIQSTRRASRGRPARRTAIATRGASATPRIRPSAFGSGTSTAMASRASPDRSTRRRCCSICSAPSIGRASCDARCRASRRSTSAPSAITCRRRIVRTASASRTSRAFLVCRRAPSIACSSSMPARASA